ncbi:polysaccharide deacetylase family protein, partial [Petrimonas sp.]
RKHPDLFRQVIEKGHHVGNHTFNHLQGWKHTPKKFLENTDLARELINSPLFRPPHGHMRIKQCRELQQAGYRVVMWDVVTRDYSRFLTPQQVLGNVRHYTRNGSIIVFHDSLKAERNLREALPRSIEWLLAEGYSFGLIPMRDTLEYPVEMTEAI